MNSSEFGRIFLNKVALSNVPLRGSIELTERCNLRCLHCYINPETTGLNTRKRALTQREWFEILDQIADAGCLWLLMTGGEILVRPDFLNIYTYAKRKGFLITLFSNAVAMTPSIADYLAEWPPFSIEISLYGSSERTYERITGVAGSYERCIRGIELLVARGLPVSLKTMVMTLNLHELGSMQEFANSLGLKFRFDAQLNMRLDGNKLPAELRLSPTQVVQLDLADEARVSGFKEFCEQFSGPPLDSDRLFRCGAGKNTFHIDSCGNLSGCLMVRHPAFELLEIGFSEGRRQLQLALGSLTRTKHTPCERCQHNSLCNQCPGWAWLENGNLEDPVDYLCQITQMRAEVFAPQGSD